MELDEDLYRIGAVANLTGVAAERLRAWERRYGFAPARRVGRTRYYSRAQLERLQRIKQLIDRGQAISSLAGLSDEQLAERLATLPAAQLPRVGLIGPNLVLLEHHRQGRAHVQTLARWANMDAFAADRSKPPRLDALAVELVPPDLGPMERIARAYSKAQIIAVCQFPEETHCNQLRQRGAEVLQWPLAWPELERACARAASPPLRAPRAAPRRFTDQQLIAIAASTTDPGNAPRHLVDFINRLNAFADYALAWQGREDAPAEVRPLYEQVQIDATQARARLESALEALAEAEGLLAATL